MTHRVTLRFDRFGWESLESEAHRDEETLEELLARAVTYFNAESADRPAASVPRFKPRGGTPRELRLKLTHDQWQALERAAEGQDIPLEQLLEHAALLHLADLESGRVAHRILDQARDPDSA